MISPQKRTRFHSKSSSFGKKEGDPYCSGVFHDSRIDYHVKHPPKEFWDNFEPGKEKEAMEYYKKKY